MDTLFTTMAVVLCGLILAPPAAAAEKIPFILYNAYAPLVIDAASRSGLVFAVADLLNRQSQGRREFVVTILPRRRLDQILESGETVVVPFVDPHFFDDASMSRYQWTAPLFTDNQSLVFNPARPLDYRGPDSLTGKTLGGIIGFRYPPLEAAIAAGRINRQDVETDEQNLAMLANGRLDVVSISALSFHTLQARDPRFAGLEAARRPLYAIERRILVRGRPEIRDAIETAIADPALAPSWNTLRNAYHLP